MNLIQSNYTPFVTWIYKRKEVKIGNVWIIVIKIMNNERGVYVFVPLVIFTCIIIIEHWLWKLTKMKEYSIAVSLLRWF